ncbi:MAG: GUN4 domain-containing protein, partial [Symploca sp. SIO2C1]|nr:GUN4 domain-containing protein [Symploca sp. SIO2C1]
MFRRVVQSKRKLLGLIILGGIAIVIAESILRDVPYRLGYIKLLADYSQLQHFLETQQWKAADLETMRIMLEVAHRHKQGFLSGRDLRRFPCADLKMINNLWVQHSDNRFGFSVQREIFESLRTEPEKPNSVTEDNPESQKPNTQVTNSQITIPSEVKQINEFYQRVGWNNKTMICAVSGIGIALYPFPENCKGSLSINKSTPLGHLPSWGVGMPEPYRNVINYSTSHLVKRQKS